MYKIYKKAYLFCIKLLKKILPKNTQIRGRSIAKRVLHFGLRYKLTKIYKKFIKPGDLVFDIGANIGDYTKIFTYLKVKKVIALEPNPKLKMILKKRFKDKNVIILTNGVSDKRGKAEFYYIAGLEECGSIYSNWNKKNNGGQIKIKVNLITLTDLINLYGVPNYIKIDVEGNEYNVLLGLKEKVDLISFEFHLTKIEKFNNCLERLKSLKYNKFAIVDSDLKYYDWMNEIQLRKVVKKLIVKKVDAGEIFAK